MSYTVAQNTSFLTVASVLQKVISFFYFVFVARLVGVENTGVYFFAIAFTTIFTVVADFGLGPVLTREAARFPDRIPNYFNTVFWTKFFFGLGTYGLVLFFANILNYDGLTKQLIYISGITMFFDNLTTVFNSIFRARKNLIYESLAVIGAQFTTLIIGTVALLQGWSLVWLILAYTIPSFLNSVFMSQALHRVYGYKIKFLWNIAVFKIFLSVALPFALAGILSRLYSFSDSLLMSKLLTKKELGWWSVPYKIGFAFQFVPVALSASVYPVFSDLFLSDKSKIGQLFEKSWRYLFVIVFPLAFGLIAIADPIIRHIFGEEYVPSILPLRILLLSLIFGFLALITGALLNATNKQKIQSLIMFFALLLNIILNLILLPIIRINGAAIATLVSNALLCLLGFHFSRRQVEINTVTIWHYLNQTFWPAIVMAVIVYVLSFKLHYLITIVIGGIVYLALLYGTKVITKDIVLLILNKVKLKRKVV